MRRSFSLRPGGRGAIKHTMAFINPNPTIPVVPFTEDLKQPLSFGPTQPIVMFPVRLETRFFLLPDGGADLRVRVYPDNVHIDTHEPGLTEEEIIWGKHFWEQTWRAAEDDEAQKLAWRQLVERFDAGRAAWVARSLKPLNPNDDRPKQPLQNTEPLPTPISFPSPGTKADAWTRAPLTNVLPKRWCVFGYAGGKLIIKGLGNLIPDKLPTGPDPSAASEEFDEGELAIDAGMKWMVDFAEAEKVGMGIRLRLNREQAKGFDILLVFGTKAAVGAPDGTAQLVDLLNAHHYTDGLNFVLQGTPSNNTPDAPSGFNSSDPGQGESYLVERAAPAFEAGDESNADALTSALGLRDENAKPLANCANASAREQLEARHMNRVLWPTTWGYFLTQMMGIGGAGPTTLTPGDWNWARQHFIAYVRAQGPLPTLRVGKQPYGILPVTSLNAWQPKAGQEQQHRRDVALRDFLLKLRELWRRNLNEVPRVGRRENPDQDFADIFSMDALSSRYGLRHLMGQEYLKNLWSFMLAANNTAARTGSVWWDKQHEMAIAPLKELGLRNTAGFTWQPFLSGRVFSGFHTLLKGPLVQSEVLSETTQLNPNYIDLLNTSDIDTIRNEDFSDPKPRGLLYSVLRNAILQEYRTAAINLVHPDNQSLAHHLATFESEIYGVVSVTGARPTSPFWDQLKRPVTGVTNDPLGLHLFTLRSPPQDPAMAARVATLLEFRESLDHLQKLNAANLQRLFAGTLDLCSHRLDAWITSFATKRLSEMRMANPTGILLGGYGWVLNLKPGGAPVFEPPSAGDQGALIRPRDNPGYTHTPSLAQAATVAVLRSGHLTHCDGVNKDLLAIDLSSERVRLATWLLDGVRQGQPLGALLGYRFERRLQDARLGQFIPEFREVAPLVARKLTQTTDQAANQSVEKIAANNVVDGLDLLRKWKSSLKSPPSPLSPVQILLKHSKDKPNLEQVKALQEELNRLDDAVDAVSDALVAESVHQAVQGNPLRTASTLDAIASGEAPPPELEVARTPRTGIALTHRLVSLFSGSPSLAPEWESPAVPFRANAEPYLNAWAAKLLGNPHQVRCLIELIDPSTAEVLETKELRLNELRLSPLDFIYAAEGARDAQPSEIQQRILNEVKRKNQGLADAELRINPGRAAGWTTNDVSYGEFTELLRTARKLITGARGLDASELAPPDKNQPAAVDVAELQGRADEAAKALRQTQTVLQAQLDEAGTASLEGLREALIQSANFGVAGALPFSAQGESADDREALLLQGNSLVKELGQRVDQLAAFEMNFKPDTADDLRKHHIGRLRVIFGDAFAMLPRFTVANATELEKALADTAKIQDNDALAVVTWFQRASRVREGVARLDASICYAEALGTGEQLNLRICQLPYREDDRWVGLPLKSDQPLSSSRFSLVVQSEPMLDVKQPMAGLLVDEWVEVVPNVSETTGVVFQYDQPDAAPPQCILLAVPPDLDQPWNLWSLQQVLLETLDLARIRAVDPDALDEVGHYLPALYFAVNTAGDTVSTDFMQLK
jgi:hypothetical protein